MPLLWKGSYIYRILNILIVIITLSNLKALRNLVDSYNNDTKKQVSWTLYYEKKSQINIKGHVLRLFTIWRAWITRVTIRRIIYTKFYFMSYTERPKISFAISKNFRDCYDGILWVYICVKTFLNFPWNNVATYIMRFYSKIMYVNICVLPVK